LIAAVESERAASAGPNYLSLCWSMAEGQAEGCEFEVQYGFESMGTWKTAPPSAATVSRPIPSWNRSILTEISLCHACSCQERLRVETARQVEDDGWGSQRWTMRIAENIWPTYK
jgi:hypothetical protein